MANSIHVQLADACVTELNHASRTWHNKTWPAVRTWKPWYKSATEIEDLQAKAKIAVVPMTLDNEWISRDKHKWEYGIAIDVQKIFDLTQDTVTTSSIDELDSICQDVQDFFNDGHKLTGLTTYISLHAERSDVFNIELLHGQSIWETLIIVGIRGYR